MVVSTTSRVDAVEVAGGAVVVAAAAMVVSDVSVSSYVLVSVVVVTVVVLVAAATVVDVSVASSVLTSVTLITKRNTAKTIIHLIGERSPTVWFRFRSYHRLPLFYNLIKVSV